MKIKTMFAALALLGFTTGAWATTITFDAFSKFSGGGTNTPVFTATFDDGGTAGSVTLTMDYLLNSDAGKIMEWYFNIDPALQAGFGCSNIAYSSGQTGICTTSNLKADGDGTFDFKFEFPSSGDTFGDGESSVWSLSLAGLVATDFLFLSQDPSGGAGPFYSAIQQSAWWAPGTATCDDGGIQGDPCDDDSDSDDPTPMPEPGSLALLGIGLAGLGFARRRRRS